MTLDANLFKAILAMDAYNRGYNPGIVHEEGSDATGVSIGKATISSRKGDAAAQAAGFYGIAYDMTDVAGFAAGEKVISYRGTDTDFFTGADRPACAMGGGVHAHAGKTGHAPAG